MSLGIPYRDWPRLFGPWTSGGWSPPRRGVTSQETKHEAESYFIDAFCYWQSATTGREASVTRRNDDGRQNSEPDFECVHAGTPFYAEVFTVSHLRDGRGRSARLEHYT